MERRNLLLAVVLTTGLPLCGQYMVNPYQDQDGQVFQVPVPLNCGGNCNNYVGEYQIFLSDGHWNPGEPDRYATYRIEVVSFPFTPPREAPDTTERRMVMPDLASYGYTAEGYGCTGWAWNNTDHNLTEPTRTLMREVRGDFTGSEGGGSAWMSDYQVLASEQFVRTGQLPACDDQGRRSELPHTVLKHTVYLHEDGGVVLDSVSWVYDHTRGRMRYYPFIDVPSVAKQYYDLCFRPFVRTDSAGHTYEATTNAGWSGVAGGGTANHFPVPLDWEDLLQLYPDDLSDAFDPASTADRPPPYALLEAPLLASNGSCYAGYAVDSVSGQMGELWGGAPWNEVPHTYVIDKPIDLRLINAQEKVIYNPSDVTIAMDSAYQGTPMMFPGGTTFRTVHGTHPSRAAMETVDPLGLLDPQLVPVPSTLGDSASFYRIADGNTLIIEPCVTIMDAVIMVEAGGTLYYDDPVVDGNFTVVNQGGTVLPLSAVAPDKPCRLACLDDGYMEVKDVVVDSSATWTVSTLPGDANTDGTLTIGGTLRVRPGASLTIGSGVELAFGPMGQVVVERNAELIADGVTFTNACWTMWHGVEVWGTKDKTQDLNYGEQGFFRADSCVFEHAREAVRVYRSNDPSGTWAYNGGVAQLFGCTFRNNGRTLRIRPTRNRPAGGGPDQRNRCSIQQCTITSTGPLIEADLDHGQAEAGAPPEHVSLEGVFNAVVAHNHFSTAWAETPPPHRRGTGVFGFDASAIVHGNRFTGLGEGVWLEGAASLSAHRIAYNRFEDCIHSVLLVGEQYPAKILGNTIEVPPSPEHGYADDDVNVGYDHPVGIYALMSSDMHIEGNTISATGLDGGATRLSYGMVINRSNVNGSDPASSLAHMNSISGVHVAVQCEGRNKGVGAAGLMLECNTFGDPSDVLRHDIAVVSNWLSGDSLNFGLLRDQGSCDYIYTQAGNSFSALDADTATKDHVYFDDNTLADNPWFMYSDDSTRVPVDDNVPVLNVCSDWGPRTCQPLLLATKPQLIEQRDAYRNLIAGTEEELEHEEDSLAIVALEQRLAVLRSQLRVTENMLMQHVLEHEPMDSLLAVLNESAEDHHRWVPYYLALGDLVRVDSVIQLILAAEGGSPSLTTQIYQLRLNVLAGLSQQDPAYVTWLRELIAADPQGAMGPKALLRHVTREAYMRCPWKINDDLPGIRGMEAGRPAVPGKLRIHPNPGNGDFTISVPEDLAVLGCSLWTTDGRQVRVRYGDGRMDATGVAPGTYIADIVLSDGQRERQRVVITTR